MADVDIRQFDTTIEFEPEIITAGPGAVPLAGREVATATDLSRLKALLRPLILELLDDEFGDHVRMLG
jgi:hypothetical protein